MRSSPRRARVGIPVVGVLLGVAAGVIVWGGPSVRPGPTGEAVGETVAQGRAKAELGRRLFFDPAISRSGENSCASCHDPEHGWSSPKPRNDDDFLRTRRHSQTLLDVADQRAFHWDGEFGSVAELVTGRLGVPSGNQRGYGAPPTDQRPPTVVILKAPDGERFQIDLTRLTAVERLVEADGRYAESLQAAFGSTKASTARIADAIDTFVRTIRHAESPFDRHLRGDRTALSEPARRGLSLFRGKAGCAQCHAIEGRSPRLTDEKFHVTGVEARSRDRISGTSESADPVDDGAGRFSTVASERRAFKTPTLWDVARRAPYMHDGSLPTLDAVVRHYAAGGFPDENLDEKVRKPRLSDGDVADLVAFLESLTGAGRTATAPENAARAKRTRVRLFDATGAPLEGVRVRLVPDGDPLPGDGPDVSPVREAVTDASGAIEFTPVRRTHVRLELPMGLRAPMGEMVPDTCERLDLRLPVRGKTTLSVTFPANEEPPSRLLAEFAEPRGAPVEPDLRDATATSDDLTEAATRTHVRALQAWARPPKALVYTRPPRPETVSDATADRVRLYEAWIPDRAPSAATLSVPVAGVVREVDLRVRPGSLETVDLTR